MNSDFQQISRIKNFFKESISKGSIPQESQIENKFYMSYSPSIKQYIQAWYEKVTRQTFLQDLPSKLEEVFIFQNAKIFLKTSEKSLPHHHDSTWDDIKLSFAVLAIQEGIDWNYKTPFVSFHAQIQNKTFRVSMSHAKINVGNEPQFYLRFHQDTCFPLSNFTTKVDFFKDLIQSKKNIIISGATGSGKTSFLNSLIQNISSSEHILTLEDTSELKTPYKNRTQLISNGNQEQSLNDLLCYSLRMSPDRIILGELRSKEVVTLIQALNTGHRGVISTTHANNAKETLHRIALLLQLYSSINLNYALALKLVCQNIDTIIYLKNKKVYEFIKVLGSDGDRVIVDSYQEEGAL